MKLKDILLKPQDKPDSQNSVVSELKRLQIEIDRAYNEFQNQTDSDLLESCIYEMQSLRSKYSYLMKQAKEKGVQSNEIIFGAYRKAE
ncbi:MAG: DUF2508 family protein [Acutalibacteraceae bacterium]